MEPDEREPRQIVIEFDLLPPIILVVATFAAGSELPLVRVVFAMAADACHGRFFASNVALVTSFAAQLGVSADQWKPRRLGVIEVHAGPFYRRMAGLALLAVPSIVRIVNCVAGDASRGQVLVPLPDVAGRTSDLCMGTGQGKPGLGMVERLHFRPTINNVAAIAFCAELSLVRLGFPMAGDAFSRRFPILHRWLMTPFASCRFVCSCKGEIGVAVIECLLVELNNIGSTSFVLGMTILAFCRDRILTPPMEAALLLAIIGDILVTR